jgi:hypothetical protein
LAGWFDLVFPAVQSDDPLNHTKLREHKPFCFVSVRGSFYPKHHDQVATPPELGSSCLFFISSAALAF